MKLKEFVTECSDFLGRYWQMVIIVVAAIVFFTFIGYYILENESWGLDMEAQENDSYSAVSAEVTNNPGKRAYLTFDDGPTDNTMEMLDVLDEYDVKATFFVVGREENYYDCYKEIVERGHVLALHSYTHDYDVIYSSMDNFVKDIEELRKLLYDVTGVRPVYYRFPGGSSNSVSKVPMSELVSYVEEQGLVYFDWNALNQDAVTDNLSPEQLVDNIMQDAKKYDDVVILMHDLGNRHTTIESLPMLIKVLREEGYEILPIDENTPHVRHDIM